AAASVAASTAAAIAAASDNAAAPAPSNRSSAAANDAAGPATITAVLSANPPGLSIVRPAAPPRGPPPGPKTPRRRDRIGNPLSPVLTSQPIRDYRTTPPPAPPPALRHTRPPTGRPARSPRK